MIRLDNLPDSIALRMLGHNGIAVIWQLQVAAGFVYRAGSLSAAVSIMELADAAEREWIRAINTSNAE